MSARAIALGLGALGLGLLALAWPRWGEHGRRATAEESDGQTESVAAAELRAAEPHPVESETGSSADARPSSERRLEGPQAGPAAYENDLVRCVLYGTVLDPEGHALRNWEPFVSLTDSAGSRVNTKAGESGHYSLAGLAPGTWTLHAGATGYRDHGTPLELSAETRIVRRDLVLARAVVLAVHVLSPAGERLVEALKARGETASHSPVIPLPVATLEPPGPTLEEANDAGQNQVGVGSHWPGGPLAEAAGTGVLVLTCDLPVFVSLVVGERVIATQRVEPGAGEVTFVVDPEVLLAQECSVHARFLGADSHAPLTGMLAVGSSSIHSVRDGSWSATLPPGTYTLHFESQGYARLPLEISLEPGQRLDLGDVELPPELTIAGRLLDADGNPVVGRLVLGQRDGQGRLRFELELEYESDLDGAFKIYGLVPARYALRTEGDDESVRPDRDDPPTTWVSGIVPVSTLGGSVADLELHLVRAGILVLTGAETLPARARCKILDEHGDLLRWSAFESGFVPRFALPPGPYAFVLCDEEWNELARHALVIGPGVNELDLKR